MPTTALVFLAVGTVAHTVVAICLWRVWRELRKENRARRARIVPSLDAAATGKAGKLKVLR